MINKRKNYLISLGRLFIIPISLTILHFYSNSSKLSAKNVLTVFSIAFTLNWILEKRLWNGL